MVLGFGVVMTLLDVVSVRYFVFLVVVAFRVWVCRFLIDVWIVQWFGVGYLLCGFIGCCSGVC